MNNLEELKTIDLNKHTDITKSWSGAKNQEDQIESILQREFYHNREYEIKDIPRINVKELSILGYKKPEKAIKALIDKGVVKDLGNNIIELVTNQVYCSSCDYDRQVFIWDKEHHLETFHYWNKIQKKHNIVELQFSNKPLPEKIDHNYETIGKMEDNKINIKCKNCGYERTIYIDNYRKECNPSDKNIFIENPDDQTDIKVRIYADHTEKTFKNQEELQKFIQSKVNGE